MASGEEMGDVKQNTSLQIKYKIVKTASLVVFWITGGMFATLGSTTFVDFKEILDTDFGTLGKIMSVRTVAYTLGGVFSSFMKDKVGVKSELIIGLTAVVCALANFLKPWSRTVAIYGTINFVEGFCHSCANTVNNALLLSLWGKKASVPMHMLHFGFGFGAFLGPLIAKDFLSVRCPDTAVANTTGTKRVQNSSVLGVSAVKCVNSTEDNPVILAEGRLQVPFSIVGILLASIGAVFLSFYTLERCFAQFRLSYAKPPKTFNYQKPQNSPRKSKCDFLKTFSFRFMTGLFFLYMFIPTFEGIIYMYLFTFAYESGTGFTKEEAALLSSAYFGSYTLSRLVSSLIAHFVSVKIMIFVEFLGSLGSLLSMLFLGFTSKVGMWASACLLGVLSAPIYPSGLAWGDRFVTVKASVVAATEVGSSIGAAVCVWGAGKLVEMDQPRSYLYVACSGCAVDLFIVMVMSLFGRRHGDRHFVMSREEEDRSATEMARVTSEEDSVSQENS